MLVGTGLVLFPSVTRRSRYRGTTGVQFLVRLGINQPSGLARLTVFVAVRLPPPESAFTGELLDHRESNVALTHDGTGDKPAHRFSVAARDVLLRFMGTGRISPRGVFGRIYAVGTSCISARRCGL